MKKKALFLSTGALALVASVSVVAVSCGESKEQRLKRELTDIMEQQKEAIKKGDIAKTTTLAGEFVKKLAEYVKEAGADAGKKLQEEFSKIGK